MASELLLLFLALVAIVLFVGALNAFSILVVVALLAFLAVALFAFFPFFAVFLLVIVVFVTLHAHGTVSPVWGNVLALLGIVELVQGSLQQITPLLTYLVQGFKVQIGELNYVHWLVTKYLPAVVFQHGVESLGQLKLLPVFACHYNLLSMCNCKRLF